MIHKESSGHTPSPPLPPSPPTECKTARAMIRYCQFAICRTLCNTEQKRQDYLLHKVEMRSSGNTIFFRVEECSFWSIASLVRPLATRKLRTSFHRNLPLSVSVVLLIVEGAFLSLRLLNSQSHSFTGKLNQPIHIENGGWVKAFSTTFSPLRTERIPK